MPCLEAPRGSIWCCLVLASKNVCLGLASALPRRFCLGLVLASNLLPRPCLVQNLNITRICSTTGTSMCACSCIQFLFVCCLCLASTSSSTFLPRVHHCLSHMRHCIKTVGPLLMPLDMNRFLASTCQMMEKRLSSGCRSIVIWRYHYSPAGHRR